MPVSLDGDCSRTILVRCLFHPVLPQWHVKDSGHFAKTAGGRLHLNTHPPSTKRSRSALTTLPRHIMGTYEGNEFTRKASVNARPGSSQLTEPLWTYSGLKSGNGMREVISIKKTNLNAKAGTDASNIFPLTSSHAGEKPPPPPPPPPPPRRVWVPVAHR